MASSSSSMPQPASRWRLGSWWRNRLLALAGLPWQRRAASAALLVRRIRYHQKVWESLSDEQVLAQAKQFQGRARGGESLDRLLPEVFGLVSVAVQKALGLTPHDVQLAAGALLHWGCLAELATGEGKTLVAAFPAVLNALTRKGVHVVTVNDYLAGRDSDWLRPVFHRLGLSVGVVQAHMSDPERATAYRCDVTYGVASTFGFDYLRDQLRLKEAGRDQDSFLDAWADGKRSRTIDVRVQREHHYAIVDEADNIFIDEARTPLVISTTGRPATPDEAEPILWADSLAKDMRPGEHFRFDEQFRQLDLTDAGLSQMRYSRPPKRGDMDDLHEKLQKAIHAHHRLRRDQHYLVDRDKIVIIDEFTGRTMPDRSWGQGLHQAVEAKEGLPLRMADDHAARITFQSYFRFYDKLGGMTATASPNWVELRRVYKLWVVPVPTNRPVLREQWPDRVFPTEEAKFAAVVEEVLRLRALGRPVLIGTRSVEKSEKLSAQLREAGIEHAVLNARFHAEEAKIIAAAGQPGRVTIATNMAGRGTDIVLGPGVAEAGGLHVLGTERHEAARIDRQLAGRSGRQGDPGSCQFFLSLEDELLEGLGAFWREQIRKVGRGTDVYDWSKFYRFFLQAQRALERRHYRERVDLLAYERNRTELLEVLAANPHVD